MSSKNPAEVYEQYLGRSIADPFTRVLLKLSEAEVSASAFSTSPVALAVWRAMLRR